MFSGVCYFFEEVCCFQERGLRAQSVQGLLNLMSKVTSNGSKINLIQILSRLRSTGNLEKRLTATKLLPKIAELLKGQEELFKNVKGNY